MRIKLDENLPEDLAALLGTLGHDVHTAREEGLSGAADPQIWKAAQDEQRFLITQDLDFSDFRRFIPGTHCGLLLLRLRSPSRRVLSERIMAVFRWEAVETWSRCLVVVTSQKIRVRRPT
jgi:predicted nuclease of predicted toxin-antitoxin system